ncbi:SPP-like hydrolase [Methanocorpusculum labreanum Z]|uniref:Phosphoglycolate phosphatase n=1 Tax=Methanocorpusculum labreanum (strain ATCC 43576 / DSM 4855 / Z) TaxID=410358 RepID=A2SR55_METLZ|nr:phosphoglycolate phosphatase [Methanocorpusculum labreanum]ABN06811.1 SPP-like hydrolase [Methanocorpusculum labreanum Z]
MPRAFITDIDGTLTDDRRRLSTEVVDEMRKLLDNDIPIILASGNTLCFLDAFSHMIGTDGTIIAENGGVYRLGYLGKKQISGNQELCLAAYQKVVDELQPKGDDLRLFSNRYRDSDIAFSRDAPTETVKEILKDMPVVVIDTGFAIHLQVPGITKGAAFEKLAEQMGLAPSDFLVAGDSVNDVSMLKLGGISVAPANASPEAKMAADHVMEKSYGEGTAEALRKYF